MKHVRNLLLAAALAAMAAAAVAQVYGPNTQIINGRPVNLTNYTTDNLGRVISNTGSNSGAGNWQSTPVGQTENVAQPAPTPAPTQFVPPEVARTIGNQTAAQQKDSVQDILGANMARITYSTESQTLSCPGGYTGSIVQTRQVATTGAGVVTNGSWTEVSNTCTLIPPVITTSVETRSLACPVGQTGSITQTRTVTLENGVPASSTVWAQSSNTCSTPPVGPVTTYSSENRAFPCPAGQTGDMYESRQVTYTNGNPTAYGPWNPAGNTCAIVNAPPPPPPAPVTTYSTETQTLACLGGQTGAGTLQTRQVTFTNGVPTGWGSWVTVSIDCNQIPQPQPQPPVWITVYYVSPCNSDISSMSVLQSELWTLGSGMNGPYLSYGAAQANAGWAGCGL